MYKLLLCLRYLRTRWIALASIISVTLGVATLIVVNSVMEGFTSEMQQRIHGILSDLVITALTVEGIPDYEAHAAEIRRVAGDDIEALSPVVHSYALLFFDNNGHRHQRQVEVLGIDEKTQGDVSAIASYLQHPANRRKMSFELRDGGYDTRDHQADGETPERKPMAGAGWAHRRLMALQRPLLEKPRHHAAPQSSDGQKDPFAGSSGSENPEKDFDPAKQQNDGAVLGFAMVSRREHSGEDLFYAVPGDDVTIALVTAGQPPTIAADKFTVVDLYESKMSEYDAKYVFVPIRKLQELRGMYSVGADGRRTYYVNAIQIRLKPGVEGDAVRDKLQKAFNDVCPGLYGVATWRDQQGPLLNAVELEIRLLNVLLFMIIAVAGFGILAIFYMIVVEKTRDIGILKSLGASAPGVMGIFLSYGLALGIVGSGAGLVLGLLFVHYINAIANGLAVLTGKPVFDPAIYYFSKIPTVVEPWTVTWVVAGAIGIAVVASVLPALRAARMHPVEALRHE